MDLLLKDSDTNRRLAMISIDNSVELMMQTYVSLPKRIYGLDISRKKREEICADFPRLLDGLEEHASQKIIGIDLGLIEWFHRLRNELYHQGNGLTVERLKVEAYSELASKLFESLFETKLALSAPQSATLLGRFLDAWIRIEKIAIGRNALRGYNPMKFAVELVEKEPGFTQSDAERLMDLRNLRNQLVHGQLDPGVELTPQVMDEAESFAARFERLKK
ncbi:hypothetical protein [Aliiroseovarius sediminilitoris]|nr:hypothetical protein [Aliiroseovarius sediminilitoris]